MQANPNYQGGGGGLTGGANAGMGNTGGFPNTTSSQGAAGQGNGDMLDKGVDYAERRAGHEQSHSTTEKISDTLRKGVQKVTGKTLPVQDKDYR